MDEPIFLVEHVRLTNRCASRACGRPGEAQLGALDLPLAGQPLLCWVGYGD